MLVVATAFETEARSKTLAVVTAGESELVGESAKGFQRDQSSGEVTAIEAAGKAARAMAFRRTSKASLKIASCRS